MFPSFGFVRLEVFPRATASLAFALGLISAVSAAGQAYWPQFRGPLGNGVAPQTDPPIQCATTSAVWVAETPPGHSSPVVWGDKIFLTAIADNQLQCRAYDRRSGALLWSKPVAAEEIEKTHPFSNAAAPTPVVDQNRAVFYLGSRGLLAYTHDGELAWEKKLPPQASRGNYGSGASPVLCGDLVVLALDTDGGSSRLLALKRSTGEQAWEAPRPGFSAGWSTPVVCQSAGQSEILLLGSKRLVAYDPANGSELWSMPGFTLETAASPAFDEAGVYVCSAGIGGRSSQKFESPGWDQLLAFDANKDGKVQLEEPPEDFKIVIRPELPEGHPGRRLPFDIRGMLKGMDGDKDGALTKTEWDASLGKMEASDVPVLMALRAGASVKDTERVTWKYGRGIPEVPSPLCHAGKLFLVRDGGLLQVMDATKGEVLYQERLGVGGGYVASPVGSGDRVYLCSHSGTVIVIDARSPKLNILARNPLGEKISATPAFVEKFMYIRTDKHLYAFKS